MSNEDTMIDPFDNIAADDGAAMAAFTGEQPQGDDAGNGCEFEIEMSDAQLVEATRAFDRVARRVFGRKDYNSVWDNID